MKALFFLFLIFTSGLVKARSYDLEIVVKDILDRPCPEIQVRLKLKEHFFALAQTNDQGAVLFSINKLKEFQIEFLKKDSIIHTLDFKKDKRGSNKRMYTIWTDLKDEIDVLVKKDILDTIQKYGYESFSDLPDSTDCGPMYVGHTDANFYNGIRTLMVYIHSSIDYPKTSVKYGDQGKVYVKFIIEKDGTISSVEIERGVSKEIDWEAKRVIESMPKWIPAFCYGVPVKTRCRIPIVFTLD